MQHNNPDFEIKRKLFHLSGIVFPILYLFIPKVAMVIFLFFITIIVLYLDISRHYNDKVKNLVNKLCGNYIRLQEQSGNFTLSGASFMALGFFSSALLFSKALAINCFLVLIISDCIAAVVGIKTGAKRQIKGKTFEGSMSFFISSIFVSLLSYYIIPYPTGFFVIIVNSLIITLIEYYSERLRINDNFAIPVCYGLNNYILNFIL